MRKRSCLVICVFAGACGSSDGSGNTSADTLTQRQRDSIVAASKLPGARAVDAALRASDAAAKRASTIDSIGR